jgi:hypothetical protein
MSNSLVAHQQSSGYTLPCLVKVIARRGMPANLAQKSLPPWQLSETLSLMRFSTESARGVRSLVSTEKLDLGG